MSATLINATGLQFGVKEDETDLVIEKVTRTYKRKNKAVLSKQGEIIGHSFYDATLDVSISGLKKSTGTLIALALGAVATIANVSEGHGITGGSLLLHEVSEDETQEDFVKTDLKLTRYPLVPAV